MTSDTTAGQIDTACIENGWMSADGGKWHRAPTPEPVCYMTQTAACGMTFQPLNVMWHGERPPTIEHFMCQRKGCKA